MTQNELIVQRPQFDMDKLEVGMAVEVWSGDTSVFGTYTWDALIAKADPLNIKVIYVNFKPSEDFYFDDHMGTMDISINDVVNGKISIVRLETDK